MAKESRASKILYAINKLVALVSLAAYALPFLAPKLFPFLSVLTLGFPLLLLVNFFFFAFWVLQLKKKFIPSALILILGVTFITKFYNFSNTKERNTVNDEISLLSYNVRLFNKYEWLPSKTVPQDIFDFIAIESPSIVCLQEYAPSKNFNLNSYPYKYISLHGNKVKTGQAIFSKFPIINKDVIGFPNSNNNVIYADLVIHSDTVRVYSMHLQSIKITKDLAEAEINEENSKHIFNRISSAFTEQQLQSELIADNYASCNYKKVMCGDMNNSAFSYVYRTIKDDMNDVFEKAGSGFGRSYNFNYYPARIDYIFLDKSIECTYFKTDQSFKNSDHFPLLTSFKM